MAWSRRPTTQDITWFLDQRRNQQLNMDPNYQRRSVWSPGDRRFFLDTIFRGYPSPAIFLHKVVSDTGRAVYAVVDGKQRLETIFRFVDNRLALAKDFGDVRLDGKKWRDIEAIPELQRLFWDYVVPVEFLSFDEATTQVNEVFDRLNRNSRKLVEQELRHAKYEGWFISFAEAEAEAEPDWREMEVVTTSRAKRMKDVQFLSELLIVLLKGEVSGFDQGEIESFTAQYEDPSGEEGEAEVDLDRIVDLWHFVRRYIANMRRENAATKDFWRSYKHFYTLWAVVALNRGRLPSEAVAAKRYVEFMALVEQVKDPNTLAALKEQYRAGGSPVHSDPSLAFEYHVNSTGANTEYPQRKARYAALSTALLEPAAP